MDRTKRPHDKARRERRKREHQVVDLFTVWKKLIRNNRGKASEDVEVIAPEWEALTL